MKNAYESPEKFKGILYIKVLINITLSIYLLFNPRPKLSKLIDLGKYPISIS